MAIVRLQIGLVAGSDIDVVKAVFAAFAERDVEGVLAHARARDRLQPRDRRTTPAGTGPTAATTG